MWVSLRAGQQANLPAVSMVISDWFDHLRSKKNKKSTAEEARFSCKEVHIKRFECL